MRMAIVGLALIGALAACGDDAPRDGSGSNESGDRGPQDGSVAMKDAPRPTTRKNAVSPETMRKIADRIKRRMDAGNRTPGMPNESIGGDQTSPGEALALRRLRNAQLGGFSEEEAKHFIEATGSLRKAGSEGDRKAVLEKYEMSEMRYRLVESIFKRAQGMGPALNEVQAKLVDPWLTQWIEASGDTK